MKRDGSDKLSSSDKNDSKDDNNTLDPSDLDYREPVLAQDDWYNYITCILFYSVVCFIEW